MVAMQRPPTGEEHVEADAQGKSIHRPPVHAWGMRRSGGGGGGKRQLGGDVARL